MAAEEFDNVVAGFDGFMIDEQVRPEAKPALVAALKVRLADGEPASGTDPVVLATVDEVVSRLSDGEYAVVRLRYGFDDRGPLDADGVAAVLGVPAHAIALIEARAQWKLNPRWGHE